jgi:hypothetical protein
MALSENGWPVLPADSPLLYTWSVPLKGGTLKIRLRHGSVGFLLCYALMLWDRWIEPVYGQLLDDWGYAYRPVRDGYRWSNHASGTAFDVNATRHPLGRVYTVALAAVWRRILAAQLGRLLRWGGDYSTRKDEMHTEVAPGVTMGQIEHLARKRMGTKRGLALLDANPTQRKVIVS